MTTVQIWVLSVGLSLAKAEAINGVCAPKACAFAFDVRLHHEIVKLAKSSP
eukprot:c44957_g1_i1 orf=250-402(+)